MFKNIIRFNKSEEGREAGYSGQLGYNGGFFFIFLKTPCKCFESRAYYSLVAENGFNFYPRYFQF